VLRRSDEDLAREQDGGRREEQGTAVVGSDLVAAVRNWLLLLFLQISIISKVSVELASNVCRFSVNGERRLVVWEGMWTYLDDNQASLDTRDNRAHAFC
jgi:hypothetical protein